MKNLENVKKLLNTIGNEINGVNFIADARTQLSCPLFTLCLDHAAAIMILFDKKVFASAFALIRPFFEASIRANWIQFCSSEDEIDYIKKHDKFKKSASKMTKELEAARGYPDTLTRVIENRMTTMHSFTHGGMLQISKKYKGDSLEPNFELTEIDEVLRFLALISIMAFSAIAEISSKDEKQQIASDLLSWINQWAFEEL